MLREGWDQFAFCVTLWEALVGERPFVGGTLIELATHVMHGERQRLKGSAGVPAGVRRALLRGLEVRPERRFPSMEALLAALERGQAASRRRRVFVGLGVACAAVAGGAGWLLSDRAGRVRACEAAGAEIAEVWNPAAAAALKEALLATGASHAARTFDKAVPWIDRWTADWSHMRAELCAAANVEGTRPRELDALSTACLEERREELSARLAAIGEGGATAVLRAVPMFSGLSQLGPCADRATLERRPALPTEDAVRDRVLVVRRDLIRAMGLHAAGRSADGLARAEAALAAAESLAYPPLVAEALLTVGGLAVQTHELERAEDTLTRAYVEAGSLGADDVAVQAVMQLVGTVGYLRGRPAEGLLWSRSAEMLLRKLGLVDALPGAALAIHLAAVHQLQGTYAEAVRLFGRALEIRERELGPTHPEVASALNNLGETYRLQGDIETSLRLQERALAIYEEQLGPDHPNVAASLNNLGLIREARGELELARGLYERAMKIREEQLGPDHIDVAVPLSNLSNVRDSQGAHDEAQRLLERAVAIHEKALGTEHPRLASLLVNLAAIHLEQRRFDAAQPLAERALRITASALGPDHPDVAYSLDMLGALALARGRPADAISPLERALVINAGAAPLRLAQTRGLLARALWGAPVGAGRDRGRAGDLAGQALAVLRAAGDAHAKDVAELEAWLRSREP